MAHRPLPALSARFAEGVEDVPAAGPGTAEFAGGSDFCISVSASAVEADYLGQLCSATILMPAPDRIVIGGGVMAQSALLPLSRARTRFWLGGYVADLDRDDALGALIQSPASGRAPGLIGAFDLALAGAG
ncbi:MAG: ROK family protein [Sandarakinorhabdus sp.]|nr:ROK family protein [Sandarakinorhabdus sp.]